MKKMLYFALVALVMMSCGKSGGRMLTSATGTIYECLVVMPDRPLDAAQRELIAHSLTPTGSAYAEPVNTTYDMVRATLAADMPCMPQMEPYLKLSQVNISLFDDYLKPTRNILIIDVNRDKYTGLKVQRSRNVWAKPQAVFRIQAPNDETVVSYWMEHGTEVRDWFVREEMNRQISFSRANTNKEARARLQQQGYDMLIPEDYMLIMDTAIAINDQINDPYGEADRSTGGRLEMVNVLWCCNNKGPMRRDILVYSYPYTAQEQFSHESICAMRDAVMGRLVSAQVEGSHMGTEYRYFPPVSRQVKALNDSTGGFYAVETRGLWKILDGEAMGGPYVSLTRLDQVNGRVVTAETFLFASGQKKRNALRQAEAILYSLEMPNERQRR